jgi:hypothetical protein
VRGCTVMNHSGIIAKRLCSPARGGYWRDNRTAQHIPFSTRDA